MLWLCIYLDRLMMDALARSVQAACCGVVEEHRGQTYLLSCDHAAQQLGVEPPMPLTAVYALAPNLTIYPRQHRNEYFILNQVAQYAYRFSRQVHIDKVGHMVLLEIAASARLFGGLHKLYRKIARLMSELTYSACLTIAPTPKAAQALARAGIDKKILKALNPLPPSIQNLPLRYCGLRDDLVQDFEHIGLVRVDQILALPSSSLARRFGSEVTNFFDRLLGHCEDPIDCYQPPRKFTATVELPNEVVGGDELQFSIHRLLQELCLYLRLNDRSVQQIEFQLGHIKNKTTKWVIKLVFPMRTMAQLLPLCREYFHSQKLPAAVRWISLKAAHLLAYQPEQSDLFDLPYPSVEEKSYLFSRLRARLGQKNVYALNLVSDYRPEKAWRATASHRVNQDYIKTYRPLWLLTPPRSIDIAHLELLDGPERIESGWWDDMRIARDYYVAQTKEGLRCWVYRRASDDQWYVQGVFA